MKENRQTCLFCSIAKGEKSSFVIFEDKKFIAFLDQRPLFLGHSLLIPKLHVNTLYDLPDRLVKPFFNRVQMLGRAIELSMAAEGTFTAINNRVSQSVPHLHIHIVPRNQKDGLKGFFWPRLNHVSEQQMVEVQTKIKNSIKL